VFERMSNSCLRAAQHGILQRGQEIFITS